MNLPKTFFLLPSFSWTVWIRCKIKCAEFVKNQLLDSILERSLAKVVNRFSDEPVTTRASFPNAKIITDALWTRRIVQLVKLADSENV